MTQRVYTLGYLGRKPEDLAALAQEKDAVIFDIRFSPYSRAPQYNRSSLEKVLGKARYQWVRSLGNVTYKDPNGRIEIEDFERGVGYIRAAGKNIILMCACREYETCHRKVVGERLAALGFVVEEIPSLPKASEMKKQKFETENPRLF